MKKKEKLTVNISTRITETQKAKLDELEVNLRDVIDYYIVHHTNKTLELNNRKRELIKSIKQHEEDLTSEKQELNEINLELGVPTDEATTNLTVIDVAERLKNNCKIKNNGKCSSETLANYLNTNQAIRILDLAVIEFKINNAEEFEKEVKKYLKIN